MREVCVIESGIIDCNASHAHLPETRGMAQVGAPDDEEPVRGLLRYDALMPSMFAYLQHGGIARTQGISQMEPALAGERARVRELLRHLALMPSMFANLQHGGTTRTPGVSQWSRRQQGRGRGFEGCCVTLPACPACSRTCNTEAPHARRASGQWSWR